MKVVTSGIGLRAGHVLSKFKQAAPEIEFVGFYDPQPTCLDKIGEQVPRFDSIEQMLETTKPDLYFVGSPNEFHLEQLRIGLQSDVPHIFTEKPVVISIEETFELAKLLAEHGTQRLMVGLVLRYSQHMVDMRKVLSEGVLGQIASLEANEHISPSHGAFFMRDWRRKTAHSGGFLLEKCCHDLDIYNMITGSRPKQVASFGGRRSFLPENAPTGEAAEMFQTKKSFWESADDSFTSDGDIVDFQTAILSYESGASMAFHTNINTPDEHRRFCVMGSHAMAEGDFLRGFLKVTCRDGSVHMDNDYTKGDLATKGAHYGADDMMSDDVAAYLRGEQTTLPVSIVDALEAGVAVLAIDEARNRGEVFDLSEIWSKFDSYNLRK